MRSADAVDLGVRSPTRLAMRATVAVGKNRLYVKLSKLSALLFSTSGKNILFSEKPDWENSIRNGFRRLPHKIEFGPITESSFKKFDIVVPLTLGALNDARRYCASQRCAYPLPSSESVRICDDKYRFNKALIEAGFSRCIPRVLQGTGLPRPYILKKRVGSWGQDCFVISSKQDEDSHLELINNDGYFCQEMITGTTEFATHILFRERRIVKALSVRYEFANDTPVKGKDAVAVQTVCRNRYLDLWVRILQFIKFEGLCCVNYKVANGEPMLLEINPRFGGSLQHYFFSFVRYLST